LVRADKSLFVRVPITVKIITTRSACLGTSALNFVFVSASAMSAGE